MKNPIDHYSFLANVKQEMTDAMKNTNTYVYDEIRTTATILCLSLIVVIGLLTVPTYSQSGEPQTVEVDVPFEMLAPWYSPDGSEIEDEVLLRGTLHVTTRTWQTRADHVDRFYLHANAVDIHGTSDTTGQRFRLNGSFRFDLRDPEVVFSPDGTTFTVPMQQWTLRLHKVDPEPARLTSDLVGTTGATAASIGPSPPITVPCTRIIADNGTPTASLACGSTTISIYQHATRLFPPLYRVLVAEGDECIPGTTCVVPDGATLFNGYTGGYKPPLRPDAKIYVGQQPYGVPGPDGAVSLRWRCMTGDREAPTGTQYLTPAAGLQRVIGSCRPIYSATEPIRVWADVYYRHTERLSSGSLREVTTIIKEREFRFYVDERLMDQPPTIHDLTVRAVSRINDRCVIGELCDLIDGDIIYNQQVGDYDPLLHMEMSASDPEGDPIFVEWFCRSGSSFAPVTNQGSLAASCTAPYNYPESIQVYAIVSDGNNFVVTLPVREFYMLEFIQ